ncbi:MULTISPECIES: hypothetical protein [Microbulbifer]|uniref:hypothetical protein n=1 Tax=Microbulbifer TaxID=48073 RepID=UPI001F42C333|nr:hypothetical protein [Microbulbifer zhoushanensis]
MLPKTLNRWLLAAVISCATGTAASQATEEKSPQEGGVPQARVDAQRALLEEQRQLEEKLVAVLEDPSGAARAFGQLLSAGDRRQLQAGCSSLARDPDNARARTLLQDFIDRYSEQPRRVIARYCFGPSLNQLHQEVRATRRALQQRPAASQVGEFDFRFQRLEGEAQEAQQRFTAIRRIMLAGQ